MSGRWSGVSYVTVLLPTFGLKHLISIDSISPSSFFKESFEETTNAQFVILFCFIDASKLFTNNLTFLYWGQRFWSHRKKLLSDASMFNITIITVIIFICSILAPIHLYWWRALKSRAVFFLFLAWLSVFHHNKNELNKWKIYIAFTSKFTTKNWTVL